MKYYEITERMSFEQRDIKEKDVVWFYYNKNLLKGVVIKCLEYHIEVSVEGNTFIVPYERIMGMIGSENL